jgi:hypothetical protein
VQGKSKADTYRWFPDDYSDEDLRYEAEDWASHTSQGVLNDIYRFGFERVEKLPEEAKKLLVEQCQDAKESAEEMLAILERS